MVAASTRRWASSAAFLLLIFQARSPTVASSTQRSACVSRPAAAPDATIQAGRAVVDVLHIIATHQLGWLPLLPLPPPVQLRQVLRAGRTLRQVACRAQDRQRLPQRCAQGWLLSQSCWHCSITPLEQNTGQLSAACSQGLTCAHRNVHHTCAAELSIHQNACSIAPCCPLFYSLPCRAVHPPERVHPGALRCDLPGKRPGEAAMLSCLASC